MSARAILIETLREWGLESLTGDVDRLIKEGLDAPAVTLQLQETDAYKERFAANQIRRAKGLPVLSPAEYIATEAAYKSVLRSYGLPIGFYDQQSDFHNFIGKDVSPDELNERARSAQQTFLSADAETRSMWSQFYGLTGGAAIAAILDPERSLPMIERMAQAAKFGAAAKRNDLEINQGRLEKYADMGMTDVEVSDAFGRIAQTAPVDQKLGQRFGQSLTQADREAEELLENGAVARRRNSLYNQERTLFANRSGADEDSLNRNRRGQY